jgi:hypothetical protein
MSRSAADALPPLPRRIPRLPIHLIAV